MKKAKLFYILSTALFVAVETLLGVLLQTSSGRAVSVYAFLTIVLAFLFCLLFMARKKDYIFTQTALFFTVIADYFLVFSDPQIKLPAMIVFLFAQLCYMARIYFGDDNGRRKKIQIISHGVCSLGILIFTVAVLGEDADLLAVVSMLYYVQLCLNIIFAWMRPKKNLLLALGLLFFILCDTLVGVAMLEDYFQVDSDLVSRIVHPGFDLVWAFYLPSQMLLACSLLPEHLHSLKQKEEGKNVSKSMDFQKEICYNELKTNEDREKQ